MGDWNSKNTKKRMKDFCDIYNSKGLLKVALKFQWILVHWSFLTNCSKSFQDTEVVERRLSGFPKMNITPFKMFYTKQLILGTIKSLAVKNSGQG